MNTKAANRITPRLRALSHEQLVQLAAKAIATIEGMKVGDMTEETFEDVREVYCTFDRAYLGPRDAAANAAGTRWQQEY